MESVPSQSVLVAAALLTALRFKAVHNARSNCSRDATPPLPRADDVRWLLAWIQLTRRHRGGGGGCGGATTPPLPLGIIALKLLFSSTLGDMVGSSDAAAAVDDHRGEGRCSHCRRGGVPIERRFEQTSSHCVIDTGGESLSAGVPIVAGVRRRLDNHLDGPDGDADLGGVVVSFDPSLLTPEPSQHQSSPSLSSPPSSHGSGTNLDLDRSRIVVTDAATPTAECHATILPLPPLPKTTEHLSAVALTVGMAFPGSSSRLSGTPGGALPGRSDANGPTAGDDRADAMIDDAIVTTMALWDDADHPCGDDGSDAEADDGKRRRQTIVLARCATRETHDTPPSRCGKADGCGGSGDDCDDAANECDATAAANAWQVGTPCASWCDGERRAAASATERAELLSGLFLVSRPPIGAPVGALQHPNDTRSRE